MDDTCFNAQLTLMQAYFQHFDHVEGMTALRASRTFRKQTKRVRQLQPNNIEARLMEIAYLDAAPAIAGGNASKARRLIDELDDLDPAAAFLARLEIIDSDTETSEIVAVLSDHAITSHEEIDGRMWAARILIVTKQEYHIADTELASLDKVTLPEAAEIERLLLRGVLRVRGDFEYEKAEVFLSEFIARRPSLSDDAMEPRSIGYAYLGDIRRMTGDTEGVRAAYETALATNPDSSRAKRGLAKLN